MDANNSNQANGGTAADSSAAARIGRALDAAGGSAGGNAGGATEGKPAGDLDGAGKDGKDTLAGAGGNAGDTLAVSKTDLQKMIDEGIKAGLAATKNERDQSDVRTRFITQKMADVPPLLHDLMPKTGDLKVLARAEQDIRSVLKEWFANAGGKIPGIGGGGGGQGDLPPSEFRGVNSDSPSSRVHRALNKGA
jgi:hypothetical protein